MNVETTPDPSLSSPDAIATLWATAVVPLALMARELAYPRVR